MNRRSFIKSVLAASMAPAVNGCASPFSYQANGKVRLAQVGIAHQGWYDMTMFRECSDICEYVALCDTDMGSPETADALKAYPKLPRYRDFRRMFDDMADKIDAVVVSTPDFSHFAVAMHAMKLGKAVFVEKPLAHTFKQSRLLMDAEKKYGVVTQMGNQGHSTVKYHQFKEYVAKGIVKDVYLTRVHMNSARRWHKYKGNIFCYPAGEDIPATLDWDSWLASARYHEYSSKYTHGEWRCWYDFGMGALGDWGAHTMDCVHEFLLKSDLPTKVELQKNEGWNQFAFPCASTIGFEFPKNDLHGEFRLEWYDGADNWPELPKGFVFAVPDGIPKNSANLEESSAKRQLYPGKEMYCKDGTVWQSLSHKHPLHVVGDYDAKLPDYPPETETHYRNFIRAVRGETETNSPFSVSGRISQLFALGCIAQRINRGFVFDPAKGEIVGDEYANFFLKGQPPRKGWEHYFKI